MHQQHVVADGIDTHPKKKRVRVEKFENQTRREWADFLAASPRGWRKRVPQRAPSERATKSEPLQLEVLF